MIGHNTPFKLQYNTINTSDICIIMTRNMYTNNVAQLLGCHEGRLISHNRQYSSFNLIDVKYYQFTMT